MLPRRREFMTMSAGISPDNSSGNHKRPHKINRAMVAAKLATASNRVGNGKFQHPITASNRQPTRAGHRGVPNIRRASTRPGRADKPSDRSPNTTGHRTTSSSHQPKHNLDPALDRSFPDKLLPAALP